MPVSYAQKAPKLWRKICAETSVELSLLSKNWKFLLAGIAFQYAHGLAAHGVHYLHRPGPTLQDAGFFILPWTFSPFFLQSKRIYTVLIWIRVLVYLSASQFLRIVTFYSTQLPGPNYHCREGSELATLPPPKSAMEVLLINFSNGVNYGCGDLIFSSHMIFTLVFVRTYQKYGRRRCIKQFAWLLAVIQSLLIVASRKHYSVDVVVAWYTVNLITFFVDHNFQQLPDRSTCSTTQPILPVITRDKDGKNREELHRFLNGNAADITH